MTKDTKKILSLYAKSRDDLGKKVKSLRKQGLIPAVSYGAGQKNQNITLDSKEFAQVFREAGESTLISLKIDNNPARKVLITEPQFDPVTGVPIHVDLQLVKMDEKIKTEVPLKFIGESKAVREMDGTLVTNKDAVEIECLPDDLISEIEIDISPLVDFEKKVKVSDLKVSEAIKILDDPEETVALVQEPRSEEELAELEEKPEEDVESVEVEEKGKEETEEESKEDKETTEGTPDPNRPSDKNQQSDTKTQQPGAGSGDAKSTEKNKK